MDTNKIARDLMKVAKDLTAGAKRGDYLILEKIDGTAIAGINGGKHLGKFRNLNIAEEAIARHMFDALGGDEVDLRPSKNPRVWFSKEVVVETKQEDYTKEWERKNSWMSEGYF